jgi:hypothetical protein
MNTCLPWLILALLGAFHGINPAMSLLQLNADSQVHNDMVHFKRILPYTFWRWLYLAIGVNR